MRSVIVVTEFVLAATLMWVTSDGVIHQRPIDGHFDSQAQCMKALTEKVAFESELHQSAVVPVITEGCTPREAQQRPMSVEEAEAIIAKSEARPEWKRAHAQIEADMRKRAEQAKAKKAAPDKP
jgi:hypothetical protein